jgi:Tfp pilus assembly protein PilV
MMGWLNRNGEGLQAFGAILTAVLALIALIGVKVQIDSAARQQQAQSARDIYREFLNLSIQNPRLADPDYCGLSTSSEKNGYFNFVAYMLYTSEQVLEMDAEWQPVVADLFETHGAAICTITDLETYSPAVSARIIAFQANSCSTPIDC